MANWYNSGIYGILNGDIDLDTDDIRVALCTSTYTFDDEHDDMADITNELSGGNYARVALSSHDVTVDDVNDGAMFDAADTTFPSLAALAGTPAHAIVYLYNAADADATLICRVPLPGTAPDGNNYVIQWHADGIGYWRNVGVGNPYWYNTGIAGLMDGTLALSNTLTMALCTSSYTFDATHDTVADLTNELSGGNYARVNLASVGVTLDDSNNGAYVDFDNVTFASLGVAAGTPAYAIVFDDTASDTLLFMLELTTPDTPDGNNYTIEIAAGGAATVYNS